MAAIDGTFTPAEFQEYVEFSIRDCSYEHKTESVYDHALTEFWPNWEEARKWLGDVAREGTGWWDLRFLVFWELSPEQIDRLFLDVLMADEAELLGHSD